MSSTLNVLRVAYSDIRELDECRVFKTEQELKLMRHINAVSR